jgi:acetylornithine deacetylase/succinyl-diaminopimelate desuccinylase-like protein
MMTRASVIQKIEQYFDQNHFFSDLSRRVSIPTESQIPERSAELHRYLQDEIAVELADMGFTFTIEKNPIAGGGPVLIAYREEDPAFTTVLTYGHGDVVRGYDDQWRSDLSPWVLTRDGDRWFGRGSADNKGQHTINLAALRCVLTYRGYLGFNIKILIETGEEVGSIGLREFCTANKDRLSADVFIASDGPRIAPARPTVFMGSRGAFNFNMNVDLREGGHHSGNWGGLLANPGIILAHAIAAITSSTGEIKVPQWRPDKIPGSVQDVLGQLTIDQDENSPDIDPHWGEPGLTPSEQVFGWNSFEVLAFETGNPQSPANAIPPKAFAHCQVRFVVPTDPEQLLPALREFLDERGFSNVVLSAQGKAARATRLEPDHPWVKWVIASIGTTTEKEVAVIPNLGGTLPNDVFAEILGQPTVWVPHSYSGCSQHAADEHLLGSVSREALQIMTGIWWDLGEIKLPVGH